MIFLTINNDTDSWLVAINDHLMKLLDFIFISLRLVITTLYFVQEVTQTETIHKKIICCREPLLFTL